MDKAPDAFRTISEVAEDLDLPQHVLRFWETRFGQIKPMKRGGGRRYYRPDDVDLLRGIRHLLYGEGYTIRGVQRIFKDNGVKFVQAVWKSGAPQAEPPHGDDADSDDAAEAFKPAGHQDTADGDDGADVVTRAEPPPLRYGRATPATLPANEPPNVPPVRAAEPGPSVAPGPSIAAPEPDRKQSRLAADELQTLRTALEDLTACKRLLEEAMNEDV